METDTACNEKKVEVSNIKNKGPDLSIDHTFSKSKHFTELNLFFNHIKLNDLNSYYNYSITYFYYK